MQDHINVSGVLCSSYDTFFEAEKKIADYILEHKSEIIDIIVFQWLKSHQLPRIPLIQ